jgi:hypothetical protein
MAEVKRRRQQADGDGAEGNPEGGQAEPEFRRHESGEPKDPEQDQHAVSRPGRGGK